MQQAILNLAIHAMDALSVCPRDRRELSLPVFRDTNNEAAVSISDTGPGIPEKDLKTVFDTLYTTKAEGTGIGLSITRTIIENHGGKIWAENGNKGGAIFTFTLPLGKPQAGRAATSTSEEPGSSHRLPEGATD
jgi:signal transduction histidine kinase